MEGSQVNSEVRRRVIQDLLNPHKERARADQIQSMSDVKYSSIHEQKSKYCSNCGYKVDSDFNYCPGCGTEVKEGKKSDRKQLEESHSSLSLLDQVMENKEQKEGREGVPEEVRKRILDRGINENIIKGILG